MHAAFQRTDHRPWPVPANRWTWRQAWCDLLFAHWPLPADTLRPLVPPGLDIQEHDGTSWIGLVPFRMVDVARRPLPALPGMRTFPEVNVRIYAEHNGKPGVWFLSLDATHPLAVWAARRFFHLPYYRANIDTSESHGQFDYRASRCCDGSRLDVAYRPTSDIFEATPGTLEHWLTERYCLYAQAPDRSLWRTEVHHIPWPLQHAEAEITCNSLFEPHGLTVEDQPLLHFARRIDVVAWPPERVAPSP